MRGRGHYFTRYRWRLFQQGPLFGVEPTTSVEALGIREKSETRRLIEWGQTNPIHHHPSRPWKLWAFHHWRVGQGEAVRASSGLQRSRTLNWVRYPCKLFRTRAIDCVHRADSFPANWQFLGDVLKTQQCFADNARETPNGETESVLALLINLDHQHS
jgi:hypothetical protein